MHRLLPLLVLTLAVSPGRAEIDGDRFDGRRAIASPSLTELTRESSGEVPKTGTLTGFDDRYWVTLEADSVAMRTRAATLGLSVESIEEGTIGGVADSRLMGELEAGGLKIIKRERLSKFGPEDFPEQDGDYHNFSEAQAAISAAAGAAGKLAKTFAIGQSVEGRPITAIRFYADDGKKKPGIAFLGTHHAREHLSTEIPLLLAQWLADNKDRADVSRLLETRDIYIIPMVNPDGVEHDIATGRYRWHRKNMRKNGDGSSGVDLNRNYDYRWGGQGASGSPRSDTYHGPAPFSEPETRAVRDFLTSRPNITTVISYHTFSELILYPWGGSSEPISDDRALAAFKTMANKIGGMTGYRPMQSSELYIATGDTCDWAWAELNMFCFTFELTPKSRWQGGFYPGAGAIAGTFQKNIEPALYLIDLADDPYRAAGAETAAKKELQDKPWSKL
jgi:carboxypeptidase T